MNMKNIICLTIVSLLCICCARENTARLEFEVTDPAASTVVVVCHTDINEIALDENGRGTCILDGIDAAYARVYYGPGMKRIYVEKGDKAKISFQGNDFNGTFLFKGRKAPAVEYLNTVELTAMPDETYALDFGEFLSKTENKIDDAMRLLHARDLAGTGNFIEMEKGRITYSYANTLLMYPVAHVLMARNPMYRPDEAYYDVIRSYAVQNPEYADLDEYREFMVESAHALDPANRDVKELYPKLVAEMRYIANNYTDEKVRQTLLHHIAIPYIDNFGTDGIQDMINIYRTYVSDPSMTEEFNVKCDKWDRKKPGRMSADFTAVDINGREYTLDDFKGKYLYIDIWATWCQPCRQELPHLKVLEEQFKGRAITFLSLSADSDKSKWEARVKEGDMPGVQLYLGNNSDFLTAYGISGIPRFILLDRDGKIINSEMTRPSSDDTAEILSELKGI